MEEEEAKISSFSDTTTQETGISEPPIRQSNFPAQKEDSLFRSRILILM
jgi:hypothetical protein